MAHVHSGHLVPIRSTRSPAAASVWSNPRALVARRAGLAAATTSRLLRRGGGSTIGGRVALAVHPDVLASLGRGRVLACVSGTNGKTTSTRMLAAALQAHGLAALSNDSGANLPSGLVSALSQDLRRPAVLEVDELHLAAAVEALQPRVLVLLNLSRDQLDRTTEMHRVATSWRAAVAASPDVTVVANCDDPRVVWAAGTARRTVWVSCGQVWTGDSLVCPGCGHRLRTDDETSTGITGRTAGWACRHCGLHRPVPQVRLDGDELVGPGADRLPIRIDLPGRVNLGNAAVATAAAAVLGVDPGAALAAMQRIGQVEGRYAERRIAGRRCRLLLAKNPAGWAATFDLIEGESRPLLLSVNATPVDGRDTSWLYDVPFERLAGRPVVVSGRAGPDLSLRLGYAGIPHLLVPDPRDAVQAVAGLRTSPDGPTDLVGDYSSFQQLNRMSLQQ